MSEVVVWHETVVSSPAGDDKLCELVWQNGGQNCIMGMETHMTCMHAFGWENKINFTNLEECAIAPVQASTEHD